MLAVQSWWPESWFLEPRSTGFSGLCTVTLGKPGEKTDRRDPRASPANQPNSWALRSMTVPVSNAQVKNTKGQPVLSSGLQTHVYLSTSTHICTHTTMYIYLTHVYMYAHIQKCSKRIRIPTVDFGAYEVYDGINPKMTDKIAIVWIVEVFSVAETA